jgi:hypothetical protein
MATLSTDFIKVAQSGPTCDGRTIEARELHEIAETYNPATYTAVIWPDHERFYGNHGTVLAVETRENGDVTELWAKLQPGWRMLEKNQQGQKQFCSIEIWPDFADSGKCYLGGIAITDSPASLGTEQIRLFTARRGEDAQKTRFAHSGIALPDLFCRFSPNSRQTAGDSAEQTDPEAQVHSFVQGLMRMFGLCKSDPDHNSEEPMNAEQFKELQGGLSALSDEVKELSSRLEAHSEEATGDPAGPEQHSASGTAESGNDAGKQYSELADGLKSLTDTVSELAKGFSAMARRMEGEKGTGTFETTGPADDAGGIL